MAKKLFPILQKLAMIMACSRETLDPQVDPSFEVKGTDVSAAWSIVEHSMNTYKLFKVTCRHSILTPHNIMFRSCLAKRWEKFKRCSQ